MIYLRLFYEFFKIGLFAIGGGQATIPFLFDLSSRLQWFTVEELTDMIALSECTPGPIGVNMAAYVGLSVKGLLGSLCTTLGLVTPSVVIITIIACLASAFNEKLLVKTVIKYLKAASIGLICYAVVKVAKTALLDSEGSFLVLNTVFFVVLFVVVRCFRKVHPIVFLAIGAVFGILFL